ncbi:ABC transporter permease [Bacteriovorax sp. Seq25_V]|uniref:ABC transporter permease n=1 Tax=Bacteriovorax sp. Seq25_V TaxID=1201288 RepID=UPI00038A2A7B|nr:ABC transporter permease subunit [Bacteriovorax sp. Seq25_V]EQC47479.1 ABC-2 family transporter protein [Bacteriovorax sp. Seq25_V]
MKMTEGIVILSKKEIKGWLSSPTIYIFTAIFSFVIGGVFYSNLLQTAELTNKTVVDNILAPTFSSINFLLIFYAPILTMGAFVREKQEHTMNLLMLSNLSTTQIYFGKFISAVLKGIFIIAPTIIFPIILSFSGFEDWMMLLTNYLGVLGLLLCYLSVGMLSSIVTRSYVVSIVLSFGILFSFLMLFTTGTVVTSDIFGQLLRHMSIGQHIFYFSRGAIASFDVVYFASFVIYFSYVSVRILGVRK